MNKSNQVYVFNGQKSGLASAVFSSYRQAEFWIKRNGGLTVSYCLAYKELSMDAKTLSELVHRS